MVRIGRPGTRRTRRVHGRGRRRRRRTPQAVRARERHTRRRATSCPSRRAYDRERVDRVRCVWPPDASGPGRAVETLAPPVARTVRVGPDDGRGEGCSRMAALESSERAAQPPGPTSERPASRVTRRRPRAADDTLMLVVYVGGPAATSRRDGARLQRMYGAGMNDRTRVS
jgi:hypothetical protein